MNRILLSILPDAETVSDANGKFVVDLTPGEYVIVAQGQREIVGKAKNFKWIVLADVSGRYYSVSLNNMNLLSE